MPLAFEKLLGSETGSCQQQTAAPSESTLKIAVVFTTVEHTLHALRRAGAVAHGMSASITLIVPQIVPYPLPLTSPPVLLEFNERRFRVIASESSVETTVRIYLCRDRMEMLKAVLEPRSIVLLGIRKSWWPNADMRLSRALRRAGHEVISTTA
jgi:hypothetical protein